MWDEVRVQGRQTPGCSPRTPHPGRAASRRLLLGCPRDGGRGGEACTTFPASHLWQRALAGSTGIFPGSGLSLAPFPGSPGHAQQTVTCPPLRGLVSYNPTQGACERSSRGQVSPCFCFPHFILSGSKCRVSNPAFSFCCSLRSVPVAL